MLSIWRSFPGSAQGGELASLSTRSREVMWALHQRLSTEKRRAPASPSLELFPRDSAALEFQSPGSSRAPNAPNQCMQSPLHQQLPCATSPGPRSSLTADRDGGTRGAWVGSRLSETKSRGSGRRCLEFSATQGLFSRSLQETHASEDVLSERNWSVKAARCPFPGWTPGASTSPQTMTERRRSPEAATPASPFEKARMFSSLVLGAVASSPSSEGAACMSPFSPSSAFAASTKRGKRYIPFRTPRNPKSKHILATPPPLFAATALDAASLSLPADAHLTADDSGSLQCLQLSPFHAVRVFQAFLPLAPKRLADSEYPRFLGDTEPLFSATKTDDTLQKDEQAEAPMSPAPAFGDEALVYLTLNVAADLKRESVRGVCTLQHGVGSNVRLAVFCPDEEAPAMLALGADYAGVDALLPRIAKGWVGFDKTLAVASVMPKLLKVARVLGPRKLMPSPKSGTVVTNLSEAVRAVKRGETVEFRAEGDSGEVRIVVGRQDFEASQLLENIKCVVKEVLKARPRSSGARQDEATQAFARSFVWPPLHFVERRRRLLMEKNLLPAIPELAGGRARQQTTNADAFIVAGSLWAQGTPAIQMDPAQLLPSSVGYYR
ncbi:L1P family of ribosomal protein [Toxoplasma gondii GT1]|nr:L1P family of ribosomal protein [Toxoplasma gondii GT1]KAF4645454.1 L1P family of ribosomal protein [Toxoplasma gondii]